MYRKLWRKNGNESFFGEYLVGGRGGKKISGAQVFSPRTHQNVLSKMKRKLSERNLIGK